MDYRGDGGIKSGFRPLTGFMVLNPHHNFRKEYFSEDYSFRPLTGFMVLNPTDEISRLESLLMESFRPLTGFMVLNHIEFNDDEYFERFPSPYGVYGS